jgi:hypothetical protein
VPERRDTDDGNVDTSPEQLVLDPTQRAESTIGRGTKDCHRPVMPTPGSRLQASTRTLPLFLTVAEAASVLRTTRAAIYAMVERGQ